MALGMRKTF